MMMPEFFANRRPSQTWEGHEISTGKPGSVLGGVDYPLAPGTPLPVLDGTLEWVPEGTPSSRWPSWYNAGLGNGAAYRRPDGSGTVYGHNSRRDGRQVFSGNSGKVTGYGHVHVHDILPDGRTRARPFSTSGDSPPPIEGAVMDAIKFAYSGAIYYQNVFGDVYVTGDRNVFNESCIGASFPEPWIDGRGGLVTMPGSDVQKTGERQLRVWLSAHGVPDSVLNKPLPSSGVLYRADRGGGSTVDYAVIAQAVRDEIIAPD